MGHYLSEIGEESIEVGKPLPTYNSKDKELVDDKLGVFHVMLKALLNEFNKPEIDKDEVTRIINASATLSFSYDWCPGSNADMFTYVIQAVKSCVDIGQYDVATKYLSEFLVSDGANTVDQTPHWNDPAIVQEINRAISIMKAKGSVYYKHTFGANA